MKKDEDQSIFLFFGFWITKKWSQNGEVMAKISFFNLQRAYWASFPA